MQERDEAVSGALARPVTDDTGDPSLLDFEKKPIPEDGWPVKGGRTKSDSGQTGSSASPISSKPDDRAVKSVCGNRSNLVNPTGVKKTVIERGKITEFMKMKSVPKFSVIQAAHQPAKSEATAVQMTRSDDLPKLEHFDLNPTQNDLNLAQNDLANLLDFNLEIDNIILDNCNIAAVEMDLNPEKNNLIDNKCVPSKDENLSDAMEISLGKLEMDLSTLDLYHFQRILEFQVKPGEAEDCSSLFRTYKSYFVCDDCGNELVGDGKANGTYRLNCKACNRTKSFAKMLGNLCNTIEARFELNISEGSAMENGEIVDIVPPKRNFDTISPPESDHDGMNICEEEEEKFCPQHFEKLDYGEISAMFKMICSEMVRIGKEMEYLKQENAELKKQCAKLLKEDFPALPSANVLIPVAPNVVTYRSIAQAGARKLTNIGPAVTKPAGSQSAPQRKLNDAELERFFKGLPIRPARKIKALYLVGPEAGKHGDPAKKNKFRSIRDLKNMFKEGFDVSISNILHIDFIGRKLMEIHLFEDYVETFKSKILSKKFVDPWTFVDVDPLGSDLLRYSTAIDKCLEAAKRYSARLTKRIATTPSAIHKRFLEAELARANTVLNTSMDTSSTMDVTTLLPITQ